MEDIIVRYVSRIILPFVQLYGLYVVLHGHLSPGGGFSGGAIIGASMILYALSFNLAAGSKKLCAYGEAVPCEFKPTFPCFNYRSPAFFCFCHAFAGSLAQAVVCAGHLGCNYFFFWCSGDNDVSGDGIRAGGTRQQVLPVETPGYQNPKKK
ncbi:MnhB domain-containing protein [Candidatus Hakubella thermalkaliphila]|uniref:MnhB domain-containing protein n=1 Tax=Candidatus Hakubella thermalkaliphila TaxID=2754717 RepID=UPI00215915E1|nr:MnhB domain-containing protein [Candidatus Hakubella thermalkaliphila]